MTFTRKYRVPISRANKAFGRLLTNYIDMAKLYNERKEKFATMIEDLEGSHIPGERLDIRPGLEAKVFAEDKGKELAKLLPVLEEIIEIGLQMIILDGKVTNAIRNLSHAGLILTRDVGAMVVNYHTIGGDAEKFNKGLLMDLLSDALALVKESYPEEEKYLSMEYFENLSAGK